jgi:hypothetical protein
MARSPAAPYLTLAALLFAGAGCGEPSPPGIAYLDSTQELASMDLTEIRDSAPPPFARAFGLTQYATVAGFAPSRDGSLVVVGSSSAPIDLGVGVPATPKRDQRATFVLGFQASGEPRYSQFFPEASVAAVAVDDAGDTLLTGGHRGRATFAEISTDEAGAYVTCLGPGGQVRWVQQLRGDGAEGHALAVDAAGNSLVGGVFRKELVAGEERLGGVENAFLARLRPSGEVAWAKGFWGEAPQNLHQIAMDAGGHAVFVGTFSDHMGLGGTNRVSNGGTDVFLGAIEADGRTAWGRTYGGPGDDDPPHIALAPDGSVLVAGTFRGTLDVGTGKLEAYGVKRAYVARFEADGHPRWSVALTPATQPSIDAIAIGPGGSILLAGATNDAHGSSASTDARPFLATLDGEGQLQKVEVLSAEGSAGIRGLAVEPSGSVIVAGVFGRAIALDGRVLPGPLRGDQQTNLFLARLSP